MKAWYEIELIVECGNEDRASKACIAEYSQIEAISSAKDLLLADDCKVWAWHAERRRYQLAY
jgi:hypothetical protein